MHLLKELWRDDGGAVLSAEAVLVGSVAVLGATVGLSTVATAVNGELQEFSFAIRSIDQSYAYAGQSGCRAWTAGSCYIQRPVEESLRELGEGRDRDAIRDEVESERMRPHSSPTPSEPQLTPAPMPSPEANDLPQPDVKKDEPKKPASPKKKPRKGDDEV